VTNSDIRSRVTFDVTRWPLRVEAEMHRATNTRHRAILKNYLTHIVLEISGCWEEILTPSMTVAEPVYRMGLHGSSEILQGMSAVTELYRGLAESGATVMGAVDGHLWVDDYGVAEEVLWGHVYSGQALHEHGFAQNVNPAAYYLETSNLSQVFRYNSDALLLGEYIYEAGGTYGYAEMAAEDVTTAEQAKELLAPSLERARRFVP
jgi:hypothetical protein